KLRKFKLTPGEWIMIEQLKDLLHLFVQASNLICRSKIPLIYETIPTMDALVDALDKVIIDTKKLAVIRAAAAAGRATILKYYAKTDDNIMIRIGMVMMPRYKTSYFVSQNWPQDWITAAVEHVRDEWSQRY
ncbi:hypothetical protein BDZ89DRAFT_909560, partial [Hymenopellis radicata]